MAYSPQKHPGQTHVGFSLFKRKVTAANLSLKFSVFLGNSKPQTRSCSVHLICKSGQFARREFALQKHRKNLGRLEPVCYAGCIT
jgi:hypothetical protein